MRPRPRRLPDGRDGRRRSLRTLAALGAVALAACQSLSALECPGGALTCTDAGAQDGTTTTEGAAETGTDGTSASDGGADASSDTGSDGSIPTDARGEADVDAAVPIDAGPDTTGVACMGDGAVPSFPPTAYCSAPTDECCYRSPGQAALSCVSAGGGCNNGTDIECDKPSQCAGTGCWICLDGTGALLGTSCSASALVADGCEAGTQILPLCTPAGGGCDASQACSPQTVGDFPTGWFHTCQ